ncbi:MAG: hypothetical protein K0Q73_1848 [Paenibacillus sp.]|nr:hypothetical protein [Paenibacillus sp.]
MTCRANQAEPDEGIRLFDVWRERLCDDGWNVGSYRSPMGGDDGGNKQTRHVPVEELRQVHALFAN